MTPTPRGLSVETFEVDGQELAVFKLPLGSHADLLAALTPAEREIVSLLLTGMSREEIARARGRSKHTITKQLRSAYGKLGVGSRHELFAKLG